MAEVSSKLFPFLFADDTNVFINGNNIDLLTEEMNTELNKLVVWLQTSRLSLNVNKTHFMIFKGRKKKLNRPLIPIQINNQQIGEVTHTKFLDIP